MIHIKRTLHLFFLFNFLKLNCSLQNDSTKIIQISIPKSGTHLLAKCIKILTERNELIGLELGHTISEKDLDKLHNLSPNQILVTHLFYDQAYVNLLDKLNFKKLFIYRDPRDQVVSFAFYMLNYKTIWPDASQISFDELLKDIILEGKTFNGHPPLNGGIFEWYTVYLPWLNNPETLSVRFEDLIGDQGGGSKAKQMLTIEKIAQKLGFSLSNEKLQTLVNSLFGDSGTFREGQIGSWKRYFKKEHTTAFKAITGDLLIKLGYEKDSNW